MSNVVNKKRNFSLKLIFYAILIILCVVAFDLECQYSLLSNASSGNLENDVILRLKSPDILFDDIDALHVGWYNPTPDSRSVDKVVGYKRGRYLMYVFYKGDKVESTFVSAKGLRK